MEAVLDAKEKENPTLDLAITEWNIVEEVIFPNFHYFGIFIPIYRIFSKISPFSGGGDRSGGGRNNHDRGGRNNYGGGGGYHGGWSGPPGTGGYGGNYNSGNGSNVDWFNS